MPIWEVEWSATGGATVEADDAGEAQDLVREAVENQDTSMMNEFYLDAVHIHECLEESA